MRQPFALSGLLRASCLVIALAAVAGARTALASEPAQPATSDSLPSTLPDAPESHLLAEPALASTQPSQPLAVASSPGDLAPQADPAASSPGPKLSTRQLDLACQSGELRGKPCRVHWLPIVWQSFEATAAQNLGNIGLDDETRHDLAYNPYWSTYIKCVRQFRYGQWRDDDDFMVDYIGHGLQGGWVGAIFQQNDPKGRGLVYVNNGNYWRSRLKAMAWTTVDEIQWKIGPAGEASIGNSGLNSYYTPRVKGRTTNETGFQDFVDTPIIGFWWNVGEDAIDRFIMPHIWRRTHNKVILSLLFAMTPCKSAANIVRYKPFYYRDFPLTPLR